MKKLILILSFICSCECFGQLPNIKFGTNELIESAVGEGVYIVRTNYALKEKKTGKLFGLGGKHYYGYFVTVGYALPEGFVCDPIALAPWLNDKAYDKYRDNGDYEPVLLDSLYVSQAVAKSTLQTFAISKTQRMPDSPWVLLSTQPANTKGFQTNAMEQDGTNGWIVWLSASSDANLGTDSQLVLTSTNKQIAIADSTKTAIEAPLLTKGLLGGLYVLPEVIGVGEIRLNLRGVLAKEDDLWFIYPIRTNWRQAKAKEHEVSSPQIEESPGTEDLTPINGKPSTGKKKRAKSKENNES